MSKDSNTAIAIIGLSCRFPGAQNSRELWENILARRRQFRRIPRCRLPLEDYYDPKANDKTYATRAAVMDLLKFDWVAHRIPKSSYEGTDWVHWLAYQVAIEAVSDAGYSKDSIPRRKTGVILGNTLCGEQTRTLGIRLRWPFIARAIREGAARTGVSSRATRRILTEAESVLKSVFPMLTEDSLAGAMSNTIAGRIASVFDLDGGGYVVDGACASSLLAAAHAAEKLAAGELDMAIVGGVDVSIDPLEMVGYAGAGALTPDEMNVYSRVSNGFILGEGCGMVVLKRLEDAQRDKNAIYAVIRGWGASSGSMSTPSAKSVKTAILRAHERAGYAPSALDFIEGHGCGIPDVDRAELEGTFAAIGASDRGCGITSIKSLLGHTKGAAGVASLIKTAMALNRRVLPPTPGVELPHELFRATGDALRPLIDGEVRAQDAQLRAGVSAMGASGINCHLTLESNGAPLDRLAPELEEAKLIRSARETELFLFGAESKEALYAQLDAVALDADGISLAEMTDLAAAQAKDARGPFRAAIRAATPDALQRSIEKAKQTPDLTYSESAPSFEDRLVRPFIPARERNFFRNPCERTFVAQTREKELNAPAIVETRWSEKLGVDTEVLQDYLETRGAIITELIRADLKQLELASELVLPESFVRVAPSPETLEAAATSPAASTAKEEKPGGDDIEGAMIELIIEKTGYPESSVSLESRLLDDLNLDSIKAAEIVGTTARTFGADGQLDASMFANASIREIAGAIRAVRMNEGVDLGAREDGPRLLKPSELADPPWVRNFASGIPVLSPLLPDASGANREEEDWTSAVVLILVDQEDASPHATALANAISKNGASVSIWPFSAENALERGRFSHTFAILPPLSYEPAALTANIARLHAAAAVSAGPNRFPRQRVNALTFVQLGEQGGTTAFAASVHLERSRQRVRIVEVAEALSPEAIAELVIREAEAPGNWSAACWDANGARREHVCRLHDRSTYESRDIAWSADDVVIATGGARGITAECALAFARTTGVKLALVGNTPHKPGDAHATHAEIDKTLARAAADGLTARYYAADVTDETVLATVVEKIERELGAIRGVIHGAGLNTPKPAEQLSKEDARAQLWPKVQGAINLMKTLDAKKLKMFSALTSIIGVAGIQGNAWYALANALTDLLLGDFHRRTGVPVLAAAYGIWSEVGMGARLGAVAAVEKLGTAAIPPSEGAHRFVELMLNDPGCRQVVVVARLAALDTWKTEALSIEPRAHRYLEKVMRAEHGVDLVVRAQLDLERDPYLRDHTWSGSPLFPAVFGIEAMAQAVAFATQRREMNALVIEDLRFQRPIIVHPEYGAEIQISALVAERSVRGEPLRVTARVSSKQLGFKAECFSATFVLEDAVSISAVQDRAPFVAGSVRPEDFYGSHLFHGPDYRRIVEVAEVSRDRVAFRSEYDVERARSASGQASLLSGDPFFLDTLLHGMAIGRLESVALPTAVSRLVLSLKTAKSAGPVLAITEDVSEDEYRGTAIARDERGEAFAMIEGVRLKAIEHRESQAPRTVERAEVSVRAILEAAALVLGVEVPPSIELGALPGIHQLPREERHARELPLLAKTIDAWKPNASASLSWIDSGKPIISGGDVSLSHDGDFGLAVAGPGPQGCDLLIVEDRSQEQWVTMLGHRRRAVLAELSRAESASVAGARVWAAIEASRKTERNAYEVRLVEREGVSALIETREEGGAGAVLVLTALMEVANGKHAMIAVVVSRVRESVGRLAG